MIAAATISAADSVDCLDGFSVWGNFGEGHNFRDVDECDGELAGGFSSSGEALCLSCNMCRKVARCEGEGSGSES